MKKWIVEDGDSTENFPRWTIVQIEGDESFDEVIGYISKENNAKEICEEHNKKLKIDGLTAPPSTGCYPKRVSRSKRKS